MVSSRTVKSDSKLNHIWLQNNMPVSIQASFFPFSQLVFMTQKIIYSEDRRENWNLLLTCKWGDLQLLSDNVNHFKFFLLPLVPFARKASISLFNPNNTGSESVVPQGTLSLVTLRRKTFTSTKCTHTFRKWAASLISTDNLSA